jgi:hypothetical protein
MPSFLSSLSLAVVAALIFYLGRTPKEKPRTGLFLLATGVILISPWIIPSEFHVLRLFAALQAVTFCTKLYDLQRNRHRERLISLQEYFLYLFNIFNLVAGKNPHRQCPNKSEEARTLLVHLAGLAATSFVAWRAYSLPWQTVPFLIEHTVKLVLVFLCILFLSRAGAAFFRLLGSPTREFLAAPHLASTPADFWRRWNQPAQQFLYENVFKPSGGQRAPVQGVFFTFGISACIHEYVFGVATGRVMGYQTLFFLLQACGVASTLRFKPKGRSRAVGNGLTLLFLVLTSVVFFLNVQQILPFYSPARSFLR